MKNRIHIRTIAVFIALCLSAAMLAGCGKEETAVGGGIAVVLSGPVDDGAFNQLTYEGSKDVADETGVECVYRENVSPDEQLEVIRELAKSGCGTVIGQGGQFGEALAVAAEEFPDTRFIFSVGNVTYGLPNLSAATVDYYEAGYIGGVLAALSTKSGNVAMITGEFYENHRLMEKGFHEGVAAVDPAIRVESFTTGDWGDADVAADVTRKVIEKGFDTLFPCLDAAGAGVARAAEEADVKVIGSVADYAKEYGADEVTVGSVVYDWYSLGRLEADGSLADGGVHMLGRNAGGIAVVLNAPLDEAQQAVYDELMK